MEIMDSGGELIRDDDERVIVSVRLRPLNEEEITSNDVSDWECINSDTIVYKNACLLTSQRLMYPTAYTFDRVFRSECSTRMVYEQGAKNVAMSAVRGVDSTIIAYGETSSGKTHTMSGITEYAIADIYDYIHKYPEREFTLKFSAMEIYNESIRDLLAVDDRGCSLELMDDPERGTIVENLTEEILRDRVHANDLLFVCEAQRPSKEKSHRIIRLTIESLPREFLVRDHASTLVASVNFVDLAGSEQASESLPADTSNRSLLNLGTVIHKLSKERKGDIPYRDSKLTQILETSLGGNARTAIICTMSPARSNVEQSRNTLFFASCAKEVTTKSRVNIVMSDKALVKHLQTEIARLENELRSRYHPNYSALLRQKDAQIEKLEMEIKDLILQRDISRSQIKQLLQMLEYDASSTTQVGIEEYPHLRVQRSPDSYTQEQEISTLADTKTYPDELSRSSSQYHLAKIPCYDDNFELSNVSPNILQSAYLSESDSFYGWQEIEKQINGNLEDLCREVNRIETEHSRKRGTTESNLSFSEDHDQFPAINVRVKQDQKSPLVKDQGFISSRMEDDIEENEDNDQFPAINVRVNQDQKSPFVKDQGFISSRTKDDNEENEDNDQFPAINVRVNQDQKSPFVKDQGFISSPMKDDTEEEEDNDQFPAINIHVNEDQQSPMVEDQGCISSSMKVDNEDISSSVMPSKEGHKLISASEDKGKEATSSVFMEERDLSSIQYTDNASPQKLSLTHDRVEDSFGNRHFKAAKSKSDAAYTVTDSSSPWFKMTDYSENNTPCVGSEKEPEVSGRDISTVNFGCKSHPENALNMKIDTTAGNFSNAENGTNSTTDTRAKTDLPTVQEIKTNLEEAPKINESPKKNVKVGGLNPRADENRVITSWPVEFKRLQREIIELWHACNISLLHRTYFFLLFQGDPSDAIYLQVEIKRMKSLRDKFSRGDKIIIDGQRLTLSSSAKALRQERRMLSEQMMKKFSEQEREQLFTKWGIGLNTKLRRLQLTHRVWSKTEDINHIADSALLIAKLVGFIEPGTNPSKEMLGINLASKSSTAIGTFKRSLGSIL